MTQDGKSGSSKRGFRRAIVIAIVLLALAAAAVVYAVAMKPGRGRTPKLVNQPTAAREVRPLSAKPDGRFAPLPIEPEKREQ